MQTPISSRPNSDHSAINTDRNERELGHSDLDLTHQCQELLAVKMALLFWCLPLQNLSVKVESDNKTTVALINNQGTVHSQIFHSLTHELLTWSQRQGIHLRAVYLAGIEIILADKLSRPNEILPTEWSLDKKTDQKHSISTVGKAKHRSVRRQGKLQIADLRKPDTGSTVQTPCH